LQPTTAAADAAPGVTHHLAVTYDGSNARLFLDGALLKTASASGTWTVLPYQSFMIADQGTQVYPGMQATVPTPPAYYDSLRVSNSARYTANFTAPSAKFSSDGNTVFLLNFPTNTPTGTMEVLWPSRQSRKQERLHPNRNLRRWRRSQPGIHRKSLAQRQRHLGDLDVELDYRKHQYTGRWTNLYQSG
jgi:hypothetical protein